MNPFQINSKKELAAIVRQDGFVGALSHLTELAKEEEAIIRSQNDADLRNAFETVFYTMMDCHKGASKSKKKMIERVVGAEGVLSALKILHWDSPDHCIAMQEAHEKIKSWQKSD
jgi:hypothetical protein